MPTRFGTTVITSSLFDNENVVLAVILKFNAVTGVLITLQESEVFSKEMNEKIARIRGIFVKNKKVDDVIKVLKTSTKDKLAIFDKIFFMPSSNITKQQMADYVIKEVFKSIVNTEVIEKKVETPDIQFVISNPLGEKDIEIPVVATSDAPITEEAAVDTEDEAPEEVTDSETEDLLSSIEDEPIDGDKDMEDDETLDEIKDQVE